MRNGGTTWWRCIVARNVCSQRALGAVPLRHGRALCGYEVLAAAGCYMAQAVVPGSASAGAGRERLAWIWLVSGGGRLDLAVDLACGGLQVLGLWVASAHFVSAGGGLRCRLGFPVAGLRPWRCCSRRSRGCGWSPRRLSQI